MSENPQHPAKWRALADDFNVTRGDSEVGMSFKEVIAKYRHLASDSEDPELSDILTDIERAFEQELTEREKVGQSRNERRLREALDALYVDYHRWSTRPCTTCKNISEATGIAFGCDKMANRQTGLRDLHGESYPDMPDNPGADIK